MRRSLCQRYTFYISLLLSTEIINLIDFFLKKPTVYCNTYLTVQLIPGGCCTLLIRDTLVSFYCVFFAVTCLIHSSPLPFHILLLQWPQQPLVLAGECIASLTANYSIAVFLEGYLSSAVLSYSTRRGNLWGETTSACSWQSW